MTHPSKGEYPKSKDPGGKLAAFRSLHFAVGIGVLVCGFGWSCFWVAIQLPPMNNPLWFPLKESPSGYPVPIAPAKGLRVGRKAPGGPDRSNLSGPMFGIWPNCSNQLSPVDFHGKRIGILFRLVHFKGGPFPKKGKRAPLGNWVSWALVSESF